MSIVNLLVTADFCPNGRVVELVKNQDVNSVFNEFQEEIQSSDLAICNLECPVAYSDDIEKIDKIGPVLFTTTNAISLLKTAGFNLLTLANNHIMDIGNIGLNDTIKAIEANNLAYVGVGQTAVESRKYFVFNKNGVSVGIINIAENEFSTTKGNMPGANALDVIKNHFDIKKCKKECDKVIVIYHGGHEGYEYPSPRMKELFRYYIDSGADSVICHHAHCYSGYEIYNEKPIFYGLGNFVFDWEGIREKKWNYGYAVRLFLDKNDSIDFEIIPYEQGNTKAGVVKLQGKKLQYFEEQLRKINDIILNDELLEKEFLKLSKMREKEYLATLQPYPNRILRGLYKRGLLPNLISKRNKLRILNTIRCESHKDLFLESLYKIK